MGRVAPRIYGEKLWLVVLKSVEPKVDGPRIFPNFRRSDSRLSRLDSQRHETRIWGDGTYYGPIVSTARNRALPLIIRS